MICPRCSLNNPNATLVCARCGEVTPRATNLQFDSLPGGGPRFSPVLARDIPIDRRGRGVRALDTFAPPLRVRAPTPQWARARAESGPYVKTPRLYQMPLLAPAGRAAALPSEVGAAPTQPEFVVAPRSEPQAQPERAGTDAAPHVARLGAWVLDALLVAALSGLACVAAAAALGPARVGPLLDRGFDYVVDGLVVDQGLGLVAVGFALLAGFALSTLSHALLGATPGKALVGLRLCTRYGERPSLGACAARSVLAGLSVLPAGLGVAWALFDPDRRTLHDRLLGTRVVVARAPEVDVTEAVLAETPGPGDPHAAVTQVG